MSERLTVVIPEMCKLHQSLLVHQAHYSPQEPWRALIIMAQIVLFQAAAGDPQLHERLGGDITRVGEIGCLACFKPDAFGQVVEAAKNKDDMGAIKRLGESWVAKSATGE